MKHTRKNQMIKSLLSLCLALSLCVGLILPTSVPVQAAAKPKSLVLTNCGTAKVTIPLKGSYKLKIGVLPSGAGKKLTYKSSAPKVATVSSSGKIKAKKTGKATITVKSKTNKKLSKKIRITVVTKKKFKKIKSIRLSSVVIKKGESKKLAPVFNPAKASNRNLTWTSSNKKVVTVDPLGRIKGIADGVATITAKANDGSGKKATATVTVGNTGKKPAPSDVKVKSIKLSGAASLYRGETLKLSASVTPDNATNKKLSYVSSNAAVATVSADGTVTGIRTGYVTITANARDGSGKSASIELEIMKKGYDVEFVYTVSDPRVVHLNKASAVERPEEPECSYAEFDNWYTSPEYTETFDFDTVIDSDTTIYANWTYTDSDGDGVPDYLEDYYHLEDGAGVYPGDYDGDGLTDVQEVDEIHYDPTLADTDGNGISDGDEDPDSDGISNLREYEIGTDPLQPDTDGDRLTDGDEDMTYGTDPLTDDTDGDGLTDGDEIALGLDPLSAASDGSTPDNQRLFAAELSTEEIDSYLLRRENKMIPALSTEGAPGIFDDHVDMAVSDSVDLTDERYRVGEAVEITSDYDSLDATLTFNFQKDVFSEEEAGSLIVCKTVDGEYEPLETTVDYENGAIHAAIDGEGTYFVLNMKAFLNALGYSDYSLFAMQIEPDVTAPAEALTAGELKEVFHEAGTVRYFSFTPEISTKYTISANGTDKDMNGLLYDAEGNILDESNVGAFRFTYDLEAGQTYYLATSFYYSYAADNYNIRVYTNQLDENGVPLFCEVITAGSTLYANIEGAGETAYFHFRTDAGRYYAFYSSGDEGSDTYGCILGADGSELMSDDDSGDNNNFRIEYNFEPDTDYYLAAKYYSGETTGSFPVTIEECDPGTQTDVYEVVPDPERTTDLNSIAGWDSLTANVLSGSPAYFKLVPDEEAVFIIESSHDIEDTWAALLEENSEGVAREITNDDDSGESNNFRLSYQLIPGHTYYYEVRFYDSNMEGEIPFSITKEAIPEADVDEDDTYGGHPASEGAGEAMETEETADEEDPAITESGEEADEPDIVEEGFENEPDEGSGEIIPTASRQIGKTGVFKRASVRQNAKAAAFIKMADVEIEDAEEADAAEEADVAAEEAEETDVFEAEEADEEDAVIESADEETVEEEAGTDVPDAAADEGVEEGDAAEIEEPDETGSKPAFKRSERKNSGQEEEAETDGQKSGNEEISPVDQPEAEPNVRAIVRHEKKDANMSGYMGQADIVFAIDTTGSMSGAISNVAANVNLFVTALTENYNVQANFALVDFRDIEEDGSASTVVVRNGSSNWFDDARVFKEKINALQVDGGGDTPESDIDALETSRRLDFRPGASKFIILITDADYKIANRYGITSMNEVVGRIKNDGITVSVISDSADKGLYAPVYNGTGGIWADIYGSFQNELMNLADSIGTMTQDGTWVLLRGFKYVRLEADPEEGRDTDKDGLTDQLELGELKTVSVEKLLLEKLRALGVSSDFLKADGTVTYYDYRSDPTLVDTDYDGIDDGYDPDPKDGSLHVTYKNQYDKNSVRGSVATKMNYGWFFGSNASYQKELGILSLLYAGAIYSGPSIDGDSSDFGTRVSTSSMKAPDLMEALGMDDVVDLSLKDKNSGFNKKYYDQHLTEVALGHRKVTYHNETKEIVQIVIRGTNGTLEEWESNFDVGTTANFGSIEGWSRSSNHMGFDITTNRVMSILKNYTSKYVSSGTDKVYWITGHSRGAAVANILGADLIDSGATVFDYTYASPKTTLASNAGSYAGIYNIVNEDDFVPCLPMWGFKHYGKTAVVDMSSSYEKEWESFTGIWDYNPDTFGLPETISELEKVSSNRNSLYVTDDKFQFEEKLKKHSDAEAKAALDEFKNNLPSNFNKVPPEKSIFSGYTLRWVDYNLFGDKTYYGYILDESPAYFMQGLAGIMAKKVDGAGFVVFNKYKLGPGFKGARVRLAGSYIGGIQHPHYTESYHVLSKHVRGSDFAAD